MMRRFLFLSAVVLSTLSLRAQSRHQWIEMGDQAFDQKNYKLALACYQHVITMSAGNDRDLVTPYECRPFIPAKKLVDSSAVKAAMADTTLKNPNLVKGDDSKTRYVVNRVADCYRLLHDYDNAELWYQQALFLPDKRFPDVVYWYGVSLMYNAKYDAAMKQFDLYSSTLDPQAPGARRAATNTAGCIFALDTNNVKSQVVVEQLDSVINAGTAAFAATYYGDPDILLFTSARTGNTATADMKKQGLDAYTADVYTAQRSGQSWQKPVPVMSDISSVNTFLNEGAANVSFGRQNLFFTRWSNDGKTCSIYMCKNVGDKWLAPKLLDANVNAPNCRNMMPFFSNDGTTLYFVSDRDGGQGGLDIWEAQLDDDGNASPAKNLGPVINTPEDEITPYYHFTSSTLFYSSNGTAGFGGFDIVKSSFNADDSTWSMPKNLDKPFNSSRDDAYFVLDRTQDQGYFSSDRMPCSTCGPGGGYCYRAYAFHNEPLLFSIHGHVYNSETHEPISNALLTFKDIRGNNDPQYIITDSAGYYQADLTLGEELYIKAQKNKFFGDATNISTVGLTDSKVFEHDFYLTPIPPGPIVIPGIEYDFNKATLRPESMKVLDDLVAFLLLNDNISVEISSHTDTRGSASYNLKLSQARAQSCVDYLISKGISPDRLKAVGYGETQPLIPDKDLYALKTKDEQEAAHQKNRRTAFRPIKEGVIMDKWDGKMPPQLQQQQNQNQPPH